MGRGGSDGVQPPGRVLPRRWRVLILPWPGTCVCPFDLATTAPHATAGGGRGGAARAAGAAEQAGSGGGQPAAAGGRCRHSCSRHPTDSGCKRPPGRAGFAPCGRGRSCRWHPPWLPRARCQRSTALGRPPADAQRDPGCRGHAPGQPRGAPCLKGQRVHKPGCQRGPHPRALAAPLCRRPRHPQLVPGWGWNCAAAEVLPGHVRSRRCCRSTRHAYRLHARCQRRRRCHVRSSRSSTSGRGSGRPVPHCNWPWL